LNKRQESKEQRYEELLRSLEMPHSESLDVAQLGMADWTANILAQDGDPRVNEAEGNAVHWVEGTGWLEGSR
jgi:hypothetical protein